MATTPLAYNTGSAISGTLQVGSLAVGTTAQEYSLNLGGVKWWMGPEESEGYVIAIPVSGGNQPTPISGVSASVAFYRSADLTNGSFLDLTNNVFNQNFNNASSASDWLTANGYWNSYSAPTGSGVNFIVNISQSGADVVWNGSGQFDLSTLTLIGSQFITSGFNASLAIWAIGGPASASQYSFASLTFPTSFGTNGVGVTSSTGSLVGIVPLSGSDRMLLLPVGYTSNTTISGSATYVSQSIATMGLTTGTYTWTYGVSPNFSYITMNIS